MKTFKKLLCMGLAATFILSVFASCADNTQDDKPKETGTVGTDDSSAVEFADMNFNKAEFKILHYGDKATDYHDEYIDADDYTGSTIGDAVYERNSLAEEKYNVTIVGEECGGPGGEAIKRMQAGQCDYEVIYEWYPRISGAIGDGMLYDLWELEDYLHLDQSWWVPKAVEGMTIADRLFVYPNMVSMNAVSWGGMLYFNKMLMDKHNFTYPYDYVYSNTWTYDVIIPMSLKAQIDVNGDGEFGVEDEYSGLIADDLIVKICDDVTLEDDGDGTYTVIPYTEKMVNQYEKYKDVTRKIITIDDWAFVENADTSAFPSVYVARRVLTFGENHRMFMDGTLDMTKEFIDMQSDYGVCPYPTVEPGDDFYATTNYNAPMFSIPIQVADPEMVAIVFDYLAYESERILLPAYYETTIKTKRMEDVRDYDMVDIIRDSVAYPWTFFYGDGGVTSMRAQMLASGNFQSIAKRLGAKAQASIDDLIDRMSKIGLE